jgi:hypothetical protein
LKKVETPIPKESFKVFSKDDRNINNKNAKLIWWCMWSYQIVNKKGNILVYTLEESGRFEEKILSFGFYFFFIGITHVPTRTPHESYNIVLWNSKVSYYKDMPIPFKDMMKRK